MGTGDPQLLAVQLSTPQFLLAWALAGGAAIAVFLHANRHRVDHATAWGIGVFLFLGLMLPLYVLYYRRRRGRRY
jgi:membrane protein implicated in regulation of membrane protease activity